MIRSRSPGHGAVGPAGLAPGTRHLFTATAYCKGTKTASGVNVRTGIAASDPAILPVGSVVNITTGTRNTTVSTPSWIPARRCRGVSLDIYMWSCHDALAFGRQQIEVTVLRLGWDPGASVAEPRGSTLSPPRGHTRDSRGGPSPRTGARGHSRGGRCRRKPRAAALRCHERLRGLIPVVRSARVRLRSTRTAGPASRARCSGRSLSTVHVRS